MYHTKKYQATFIIILSAILFVSFKYNGYENTFPQHKDTVNTIQNKKIKIKPSDPWTNKNIITTDELVKLLSTKEAKKTKIIQVGFSILYDQNHIPGSIYLGPASRPQGLQKLENRLRNLNKDKEIVIYCGCCPWLDCPNIRPAFKTLTKMSFKNIKVLYIPNSLAVDWINKGYPTSK
jgi:thiosulfate/3-mercaptopyruvate sulfurtransferase